MSNPGDTFIKKKSLGQNFLTSPVVPGWMCDAAQLQAGETILEIGPGTGALTRELLTRGTQVVALEADLRAIAVLSDTFPKEIATGQLTVHHADARTLDISKYHLTDQGFKVVSNIPYYLTGWLFRTLLEQQIQPCQIVFLIQKEVATRIARDEKESLLSLSIKAFGTPTYVRTVSKGHFSPSPKIDSAILAVTDISQNNFTSLDKDFFFRQLHLGFGQKRKQLLGNLSKTFDRNTLIPLFSTVGIKADVRAEDLPIDIWLTLASKLSELPAKVTSP